jgi:hypothetical protein
MAGDMLGDHWKYKESFPVLLEISINGKYAVARINAIEGVFKILPKLKQNDSLYKQIVFALKEMSNNERSHKIKEYINSTVKGSLC